MASQEIPIYGQAVIEKCEICGLADDAFYFCEDCREDICKLCKTIRPRINSGENHTTVSRAREVEEEKQDETVIDQSNTKGQVDTSNDVPQQVFPNRIPGSKKREFDVARQQSDKFGSARDKHHGHYRQIIVILVVTSIVIVGVSVGLIVDISRVDTDSPEEVIGTKSPEEVIGTKSTEVIPSATTKSPDTTTQSLPPGETCMPTSPDIWGPYYITTPPMPQLKQFCAAEKDFNQHNSLLVHGKVYAADCKTPLPNMRIEVWQADHDGRYMVTDLCRGYMVTDRNGSYEFSTINPGKYTTDPFSKEFRPAHLHFYVVGGQGHKGLVTQMYFKGDTNLGRDDSCSVCSSDKSDLITEPIEMCDSPFGNCTDIVHFDIVLAKGTGLSVI